MTTLSVYLNFDGNCFEAFSFYKEAFGGDFTTISRFGDMPPQEGIEIAQSDLQKIAHIELSIGNTLLMGSDTLGEWSTKFVVGNNYSICISPESKEQAEKLFAALSAGGKIVTPLEATFWGAYFGMFTDKFGIQWMVNFEEKQ